MLSNDSKVAPHIPVHKNPRYPEITCLPRKRDKAKLIEHAFVWVCLSYQRARRPHETMKERWIYIRSRPKALLPQMWKDVWSVWTIVMMGGGTGCPKWAEPGKENERKIRTNDLPSVTTVQLVLVRLASPFSFIFRVVWWALETLNGTVKAKIGSFMKHFYHLHVISQYRESMGCSELPEEGQI